MVTFDSHHYLLFIILLALVTFSCSEKTDSNDSKDSEQDSDTSVEPILECDDYLDVTGNRSEPYLVELEPGDNSFYISVKSSKGSDSVSPVCFAMAQIVDDSGAVWVTDASSPSDYGPYCIECSERVSVGPGFTAAIFSNSGEDNYPKSVEVLFEQRDCKTLLPARESFGDPLTDELCINFESFETPASKSGELELSIVHLGSSDQQIWIDAIERVNEIFDAADIIVDSKFIEIDDSLSLEELIYNRSDSATFDAAVLPFTNLALSGSVPLIVVPCLKYRNPLDDSDIDIEGLVPHIPGGFGDGLFGDGIFITDTLCDAKDSFKWQTSEQLARVIAHELGHYLGLYHSVESNGTEDHLVDTTADNIMFYLPSSVESPSLSQSQIDVVRRHPVVLYLQ